MALRSYGLHGSEPPPDARPHPEDRTAPAVGGVRDGRDGALHPRAAAPASFQRRTAPLAAITISGHDYNRP